MEPTTLPSGRVETPQQTLDRARNMQSSVQQIAGEAGAQARKQTTQQVFDVNAVETPAPSVTLPEAPATSFASDLATDVVSSTLDQTDEIAQAQATQNELLSGLQGLFGEQAQIAQREEEFAKTAGLETARGQLVDIRNKVMQKEQKFRRQIESIEQNETLSAARKQNRIASIEREQARELADLAIVEQASLNRFEAAQAYVDRKVKALTEQTRNKIDAMKFFYGENKEILTTAQARQFERMIQRENRRLDREEKAYERVENEKLTILRNAQLNGAPPEVLENIQTAQTIDEAMKNAGSFGRDTQALLDIEAKKADIAQGWANLAIRQEELAISKQKLANDMAESGNTYGTLDGKPQTAAQSLVNSYANRLIESESVFSAVADDFADPLAFGGVLPNILQSSERQMYEQAKRNFVNAVLRRESGAVISDQEFANAEKQYFPQAGDSMEVVAQKAENRNTVINNFYREANVPRPVFPGDIITGADGKKYEVQDDGITIVEI